MAVENRTGLPNLGGRFCVPVNRLINGSDHRLKSRITPRLVSGRIPSIFLG